MLMNLKIPGTIFLLVAFSNIKKSILTYLKTPLFILRIIILKGTIHIKTIIQTIIQVDKHKVKYIMTIPNYYKKNFTFFLYCI